MAILTMIVYHLSWDLAWFGFVDWPVSNGAGWETFAASIAASFLGLAGVSLVLAHGDGIRWRSFWRRLAVIVAAAAAVSLGTYFAFGDIYVRFGILHAIAASSLIALAFVRLPAVFAYAAAALVYTLPLWASHPAFDGQPLLWTGLGVPASGSVDYVPLAPWTSATLLGVALTNTAPVRAGLQRLDGLRLTSWFGRFLMVCGRRSLAIYLLHQPVLYGLVWLLAAAGLAPDRSAEMFRSECTASCSATRAEATDCADICACTVLSLQTDKLWSPLVKDPENPDLRAELNSRYAACSVNPETFGPLTPAR